MTFAAIFLELGMPLYDRPRKNKLLEQILRART
jgi:hypothetical protein